MGFRHGGGGKECPGPSTRLDGSKGAGGSVMTRGLFQAMLEGLGIKRTC